MPRSLLAKALFRALAVALLAPGEVARAHPIGTAPGTPAQVHDSLGRIATAAPGDATLLTALRVHLTP